MSNVSVTAEARLRARNQLTLPETVVHAAGIVEGDRFVVEGCRATRTRSVFTGSGRATRAPCETCTATLPRRSRWNARAGSRG